MDIAGKIWDVIGSGRIRSAETFLSELLTGVLDWRVQATDLEDVTFEWSAEDLRAQDLDHQVTDGKIRQLQPMPGCPWGIFLIEFRNDTAFTTRRGFSVPLRKTLRGLVQSARRRFDLPTFKREQLLFICTYKWKHYRFAYFKAPMDGEKRAPLSMFGWNEGETALRTISQLNLYHLAWPGSAATADDWRTKLETAFSVETVTRRFFEDYSECFDLVEARVTGLTTDSDKRLFTQTLFNRLMFLRFLEKKGWLKFGGNENDYLKRLLAAGEFGGKTFYSGRLKPLFFEGLAQAGKGVNPAFGDVPFLNGGLFEPGALDTAVPDLTDDVFTPIIGQEGLFYRYNFTVEESTPLEVQVAVDPEMLGKVFEELVPVEMNPVRSTRLVTLSRLCAGKR